MDAQDAITVLLAEDSPLLRESISRLLDSQDGLALTGVCEDLPSLMNAVESGPPHVVVTDIRMPPTHTDEGIRAAHQLRTSHPDVGVVVLSQYVEPTYAVSLLGSGSERRAYLLKERVAGIGELLDAIRRVADGGSVLDPKVVEALIAEGQPSSELDRLTPRERDVLAEMATGKSNAAIARSLVLSERAIEKHSNNLFAKLGLSEEPDVNRRVKAVLLWLDERR